MLFAVVDVETTGVYNLDRVLEIGIVLMDAEGTIVSEFETLINPMRDIGNSSDIHGIEARHVAEAPVFEEVAGTVLDLLHRADIVVAHNLDFDWRMLQNEFRRLGYSLPSDLAGICTLKLFQKLDPGCPRQLATLCAMHGIEMDQCHSALCDATATAKLLSVCLHALELDGPQTGWPPHEFPAGSRTLVRGTVSTPKCHSLLDRLNSEAPSHPDEVVLDSYFNLLDRVFADSILEESEADALVTLANELGLNAESVTRAHQMYFAELVAVAVQDGYISELEREHLNSVSQALGLDGTQNLRDLDSLNLYPRDLDGKTICFTGELRETVNGKVADRAFAEEVARKLGLVVKSGVSKKLDLLVVRDPYSASGKARKAKEYRVPVVTEQVFWNWAGVQAT